MKSAELSDEAILTVYNKILDFFNPDFKTRSLAVGDLNGDGKMDVAAASAISNNVTIFFGNGAGALEFAGGFRLCLRSISDLDPRRK